MTTENSHLLRALGSLGELLLHAVALELRQIVDEQHAVEMVDLMLDAGGVEVFGVLFMQLAVNKDGVIRGNYYNALSDATVPVYGQVDKKTQRAAWTVGDSGDLKARRANTLE